MSKRKIVVTSILVILVLWLSFFITDSIRCKNNQEPIFCIEIKVYEDGGSVYHIGLFYNYYQIRKINPEIDRNETCSEDCYLTDYVITPWFFGLDYAKSKAFRN